MKQKSQQQLYRDFLDFITMDLQQERHQTHRRMFHVFFFCFFLPLLVSVASFSLIKFKIISIRYKAYIEWSILVLPICYSVYVLSFEVLSTIPYAVRRGGLAASLKKAGEEGQWREKVCGDMLKMVSSEKKDWPWIAQSFAMDVQVMFARTRHLTVLAGAVFFLIMQGIDLLGSAEEPIRWVKTAETGTWFETSSFGGLSQFVGLALFLVLLYLSGNQAHQFLMRYLYCAQLLERKET